VSLTFTVLPVAAEKLPGCICNCYFKDNATIAPTFVLLREAVQALYKCFFTLKRHALYRATESWCIIFYLFFDMH
jgi:hypothetical protein